MQEEWEYVYPGAYRYIRQEAVAYCWKQSVCSMSHYLGKSQACQSRSSLTVTAIESSWEIAILDKQMKREQINSSTCCETKPAMGNRHNRLSPLFFQSYDQLRIPLFCPEANIPTIKSSSYPLRNYKDFIHRTQLTQWSAQSDPWCLNRTWVLQKHPAPSKALHSYESPEPFLEN